MPIGTYTPPPWQNHYTIFYFFYFYFFHFRCILIQISHQKCFFISISILGRSGVKKPCGACSMFVTHHIHGIPSFFELLRTCVIIFQFV